MAVGNRSGSPIATAVGATTADDLGDGSPNADPATASRSVRSAHLRRSIGLLVLLSVLVVVMVLSVCIGSQPIALDRVWGLVWSPDGSDEAIIVHDLRIPRTLLGVLVGAALGVAGALMQALTRNPLADPGLLGVNAGAAAAVVTAVALLGSVDPLVYVWFAFVGAAVASVVVYGIGTTGRGGATPVRLALAGIAVTFALTAYRPGARARRSRRVRAVPLLVGRRRSAGAAALADVADRAVHRRRPAAGVLAVPGAERARARRRGRTRARRAASAARAASGAVAITLLCGAATAAAGPIVFVGLAVPHVARALVGPDQRWVLPYSRCWRPRSAARRRRHRARHRATRARSRSGSSCALLGAPVFIAIVRRRRIAQL